MDFVFRLPVDAEGRTGFLRLSTVFSKMVHLDPIAAFITTEDTAALFLDIVFIHHGLPSTIVSDREPLSQPRSGRDCFPF